MQTMNQASTLSRRLLMLCQTKIDVEELAQADEKNSPLAFRTLIRNSGIYTYSIA